MDLSDEGKMRAATLIEILHLKTCFRTPWTSEWAPVYLSPQTGYQRGDLQDNSLNVLGKKRLWRDLKMAGASHMRMTRDITWPVVAGAHWGPVVVVL